MRLLRKYALNKHVRLLTRLYGMYMFCMYQGLGGLEASGGVF